MKPGKSIEIKEPLFEDMINPCRYSWKFPKTVLRVYHGGDRQNKFFVVVPPSLRDRLNSMNAQKDRYDPIDDEDCDRIEFSIRTHIELLKILIERRIQAGEFDERHFLELSADDLVSTLES